MSHVVSEAESLEATATGRWRRIAIGFSAVFHVALLGVLAVWFVGRQHAEQRASAQAVAERAIREAQPQPPLPPPEVTAQQVNATLQRATEKFEEASTAEQLNALDKHAAKLESLSSTKAVGEIAEKFEEWAPTIPRASQPAAEPVAGEFDFSRASGKRLSERRRCYSSSRWRALRRSG